MQLTCLFVYKRCLISLIVMISPPMISPSIDLATFFTRAVVSPPQRDGFATFHIFLDFGNFLCYL